MKHVEISIEGTPEAINWALKPYNPTQGVIDAPDYLVPTYPMILKGIKTNFRVLRFGIKRSPIFSTSAPPRTMSCNVGIVNEHIFHPPWIMYKVHSGPGSIPGAWQLQGNFLLHEGSPDPNWGWGTYGCIEVVGPGEWARVLESIRQLAGERDLETIGSAKALTIHLKASRFPLARLKQAIGRATSH